MAHNSRWLVITVRPSDTADAELLAEGLLALGGSAVQEEKGALLTYVAPPQDLEAWLAHARAALGRDVEWQWRDDEDWAENWKRGLQPRRVGRHFVVAPSWTQPALRAGDHLIVIDPEMAFGTGEHATTRGALRFIERSVRPGMRVLDVGSGSGILAIGAALLGAAHVLAAEYDEDAVLNARDNITRNSVQHVVDLQTVLVDEAFLRAQGDAAFDVIAANILSSVLRPLLPAFSSSLKPGGRLILGGILEQEADDMIEAAQTAGFKLLEEDLEEEWWGALLERPPARA